MSRRKKQHYPELVNQLSEYANSRALDLKKYSPYHMRLMDGGFIFIDLWTTGRYWIMATDYSEMGFEMIERGGEKGQLPMDNLEAFLDTLFYPEGETDEAK